MQANIKHKIKGKIMCNHRNFQRNSQKPAISTNRNTWQTNEINTMKSLFRFFSHAVQWLGLKVNKMLLEVNKTLATKKKPPVGTPRSWWIIFPAYNILGNHKPLSTYLLNKRKTTQIMTNIRAITTRIKYIAGLTWLAGLLSFSLMAGNFYHTILSAT